MDVLALTLFVSICLAGIFIVCFAAEMFRSRHSSPERDSLLPLDPGTSAAEPSAGAFTPTAPPNPQGEIQP